MPEYKVILRKIIQDTLMSKEITLPFVPTQGQTISTDLENVRADKIFFDTKTGTFIVTEEPDIYTCLNQWSNSQARIDYNAKLVREHWAEGWGGDLNQYDGKRVAKEE